MGAGNFADTNLTRGSRWRRLGVQFRNCPITFVTILVSVAWTACILLWAPTEGDWRRFGISDGFDVFNGDYWSLFTSNFAHVNVLHLFFNVYWLAILGGYTEEKFGVRFYV